MAAVMFHTNVADSIQYACRLLRKATAAQTWAEVRAPAATLNRLDQALWTFGSLEFLPHCNWRATSAVRRRSPLLLIDHEQRLSAEELDGDRPLLLNLGLGLDLQDDWVHAKARIIEVVPTVGDEVPAARARFKAYKAYEGQYGRHDLGWHEAK